MKGQCEKWMPRAKVRCGNTAGHAGQCRSVQAVTTLKAYQQSEEGKAAQKAYNQSEEGKASRKAYNQSEEGKAANRRKDATWRKNNPEKVFLHNLMTAIQQAQKYEERDLEKLAQIQEQINV
jgi:hypothetical protein